ncbi:MAG: DUF2852 domain-containing protein [Pseudomonadota bacterium]
MNTAPTTPSGGFAGKLYQAEAWLDRKGRFAWIAAMILGFVIFWPLGLALLAYMIWSKRMFSHSCNRDDRRARWAAKMDARFGPEGRGRHGYASGSSGNAAFDTYKADALRRLEEEQEAFEAFIQRLRDAKDKAQFDSFMEDRARANREGTPAVKDIPDAEGRGGAY